MSNVSGWLPNLIGPVEVSDSGTVVTARGELDFIGFDISDNAAQNRTEITSRPSVNGGGIALTVGPTASKATYLTDGTADEVEINTAIIACNAAGGGIVRLLPGTYTVAAGINLLSNVVLEGSNDGASIVRCATAFSSATNKWTIGASGSLPGTSMLLNALADQGDTLLTCTAGDEYDAITAESHVFLMSDGMWETKNLSLRERGEFLKVFSKTGAADINIYGTVRDSYTTANVARIYRVDFVENCGIRNLSITQQSALGTRAANVPPAVSFQACNGAFIDNCRIYNVDGPGVTDYHSIGTSIRNNNIHDLTSDSPNGRLGYGVLVGGASEATNVIGNRFGRMRHAIDAGPSSADAGLSTISNNGIPRGVNVVGNVATRCMNVPFSTHNESDGWTFDGNTAESSESIGFYMRGRNHSVTGNTVRWCSGGIQIGNSGAYTTQGGSGSGCSVVGNTVSHCKSITSGSGGGTNFSGRGIILSTCDNVIVSGNTITACDGTGVYIRQYANRNIIKGNTIANVNLLNTASIAAIQYEVNASGTSATLTYSAGTITATGLSNLTDACVGQQIVISAATTPANNGTFTIATWVSATSVTYANASGATDAANGTIDWVVECSTDNIIDGNVAVNTAASIYDRDCTGHAKYLVHDGAGVGNTRNTYSNNVGVGMETDLFALTGTVYYLAQNSNGLDVESSGNAKQFDTDRSFTAQTTDGTPTALLTIPSASGRVYVWRGFVSGGTGGGGHFYYSVNGFFTNNAGTLTQRIGAPVTTEWESSGAADLTLTVSGTDMVLTWTGLAATTIRLHGRIFISDAKA